MKTLVAGSTGLLGSNLLPFLRGAGFEAVGLARSGADVSCDLRDEKAVAAVLDEVRPGAIVGLAALTNVDGCEKDPALARAMNTDSAKNIASWVKKHPGVRLVHISTDHLYNGPGPHKEEPVGPVNTYARTKLEAEPFVVGAGGAVLRTNFIGFHKDDKSKGYLAYVMRCLKEGAPLNVSSATYFSPLAVGTLCEVVLAVLKSPASGVFNAGSRDGMSKAAFVEEVRRRLGLPAGNLVEPSRRPDVPRPDDMRLDSTLLEKTFNLTMPRLSDEIGKALASGGF